MTADVRVVPAAMLAAGDRLVMPSGSAMKVWQVRRSFGAAGAVGEVSVLLEGPSGDLLERPVRFAADEHVEVL